MKGLGIWAIGILGTIGLVILIVVLGSMGMRSLNEAMINHQVIEPEPGVHCVIVTAQDSSSVDCWKV